MRKTNLQINILAGLLVAIAVSALAFPSTAHAAPAKCLDLRGGNVYQCPNDPKLAADKCYILADPTVGYQEDPGCGNAAFQRADLNLAPIPSSADEATNCSASDCDLVARLLNPIINFLAVAVGIIATIAIVAGGIQYASSADDPQKVSAAKTRIINAVLGLLAFMFLWAFLQWIIPGGVL